MKTIPSSHVICLFREVLPFESEGSNVRGSDWMNEVCLQAWRVLHSISECLPNEFNPQADCIQETARTPASPLEPGSDRLGQGVEIAPMESPCVLLRCAGPVTLHTNRNHM
jgi:hypothetical protein